MKKITSKILDYLKDTIPNYETKYRFFTCPVCRTVKCNIIPNTDRIFCINCRKPIGDIFDVVNILEPAKYSSKEEITQYIKTKYSIDYCTNIDINKTFDFYQSLGFDLTPIVVNSKIPLEKDWTNKEHKNKEEWLDWYSDGINFGVKSGERSKVTCLDFDTKEISEEVKKLLNPTLSTETDRGLHFVYEYETSLPTTRIDNIKLDILNNGKQFIVFPSRVNGIRRKELKGTITKISKELLDYIKSKTTKTPTKEIFDEKIELKEVNFNLIGEGNRNNVLLHLGGILRKTLPLQQVENVLSAVNRICCNPQYPQRELKTLVESLDKYVVHDERELALKILTYLRIVGDATARDVKEVVGEGKEKTDKALAFLIKEGYAFKKRTSYHVLKKIEWKDTFVDIDKKVDFKVPYFYDSAIFRPGDMILIGGQQKIGKSHVAMNIIKQLVEQNRRPYYLNLEAGNRFARIAKQLGMKDTDFYNATNFSPESIELEDNAITIIDWLLPKDYGETDKLFQHFAEQLFKHGGLLFVFVQLRTNGDFFAKDMVAMFPAFVCRYFYEKDKEGKENPGSGFFEVDYIREPITNRKKGQIFCKYNFETKRLIRTDELDMRMETELAPEDIQGVSAIQQAKTGEEYKKEVENLKDSVDLPEDMVDNVTPLIIEGDE